MALLFHSLKRYLSSTSRSSSRLAARMQRVTQDPVQLTTAAADRIKEILKGAASADNNEIIDGVRLGVKKGGCNGLEYTINYAKSDDKTPEDLEVTQHGVKVIVENRALFYVVGTTIDYKEDDLRSGFVFDNPNVAAKCGCEMSFTV